MSALRALAVFFAACAVLVMSWGGIALVFAAGILLIVSPFVAMSISVGEIVVLILAGLVFNYVGSSIARAMIGVDE